MPPEIAAVHYRTYLLAYDTSTEHIYDRTRTAFLTRAAVLAELALRGAASEFDGVVEVARREPLTDRALDQALQEIESHHRSWKAWLRRSYKDALDSVEASLIDMKVMRTVETRRLGMFRGRYLSAIDPTIAQEEQTRAQAVIKQASGTAGDPRVATAAALGAIAYVPTLGGRRELADHRRDVDALLTELRRVAPGLVAAIHRIRMTMIAAQGGMGGS